MIKIYTLQNYPTTDNSTKKSFVQSYFAKFLILFSLLLGMNGNLWGQAQSSTFATAGTTYWLCPAGVTSVTVKCYGGGGGGSRRTSNGAGGGGGGGAYASSVVAVTPGTIYTIVVGGGGAGSGGSAGGDSYFNNATTVMAKGGLGVANNTTAGGNGGQASQSVGTTKWNGGTGGSSNGTDGGKGGGGAGTTGAGENGGLGANNGTGTSVGGGNGGNGRSSSQGVGLAGSVYGGGGGGARRNGTSYNGGAGASGAVIIEWTGQSTLATYCAGTNTNSTLYQSDMIYEIVLTNSLSQTYTNTSNTNSSSITYNNTPLSLIKGTTNNTLKITVGSDGTQAHAAWIDFNRNGTFEDSENIGIATSLLGANGNVTYTFTVPTNAVLGYTRMRVRGGADNVSDYTTGGACTTSPFGETEDYVVLIEPTTTASFTAMNVGSSTWCVGETRNVTVTITNTGTDSWADVFGEDYNIGVKWNAEPDYIVRVDAASLAAGASTTYTLSMTAPSAGSNNLTFNVVREGVTWFSNPYASSSLTIQSISTAPTITSSYCPGGTTVSGTGINGSTINVIRSGSTIGTATVSGGVWTATVSSLAGGDIITAKQTEIGKCEGSESSGVTVTATSATPAITGVYCAGNTTISGTGVNGSTIDVFINGVSQGTTTVSGGTWSKSVAALAEANSLTATQLESGKCLSLTSAGVSVGASISGLSYTSPVTYCQNTAISTSSPTITGTGSITYSGTLPAGLSLNASNGNITGSPTSASAAANYLITADNGCNTTNFNVNIAVTAAPVITTQPSALNVCEGNSGSFTVTTSTGSPTYQWQYFDGVSWVSTNPVTELSGHTATTLNLTGAPVGYNGASIRCNVTASGCSTASSAATLTVVTRPTGGSLNALSFCTAIGGGTVTVSGTSNASQYAWTLAPQLSGSSTTNSIAVTSSTVGSHSISVMPQNVAAGLTCNALSSISGSVTVTAVAGDATTYGSGSWIGYVYNSATAGAFTTYMGVVTESETFNRIHTSASGATINHCSVNEDFYAIRYKMTKSFTAGYYTLSVGGDDGVRLSVDGGATWLVNNWVDQGYTVSNSTPVYLNGSTNLVFEYYENGGGAQSSFSYTCATMTPSAITGSATVCQQNTGLYSVTDFPNLTYNWTLPGGWSGTSTSSSISLTAGTSGGTLSVTTTNGCGVTSGASSLVISTTSGPTNVNAGVDVAICSGSTTLIGSAIYSITANNYTFSTTTGVSAQNMTGATNVIGASIDDGVSALIDFGFSFVYEGTTYTQFSVSSNGLIRLGAAVSTDFSNAIADNSDNPKIMPLWDDISTGTSGYVRYKLNGSAPNRILVVEHFGRLDATETSASTSTFQTLFYETTNDIEFIYVSSSTSPGSATIGIAGATFSNYLARNANTGNVFSSTGAVNTVSSWPGNGRNYKFSPGLTYAWSNGAVTASTTVSPSSTTTYTVTATANGCSNTDQVDVTVRSIPAATVANNGPICAGNTVNLTASALAPSGQAAVFNGTSSTMSDAASYSGVANNNFTIEFWAKPNATRTSTAESNTGTPGTAGGQRYVIRPFAQGGGVASSVGVSVGTNGVSLVEHDAAHAPIPLVWDGTLSGWNHIAVVYISKTPHLYINGSLVKVGLTSTKTNIFPVVGSNLVWATEYYNGEVDNLRIFNVSKSPAQILQDMNLQTPITSGLIANYTFDASNGDASTGTNATMSNVTYTSPAFYTYTWSGTSAPVAATTETQTTGGILTGGNYTVVATSAGCSGTASSATAVTVNSPTTDVTKVANDYVWDGSVSTAWNAAGNWLQWDGSAYTQPVSFPNANTDNVILTKRTQTCVPRAARIGAYAINVNNLTIEAGHIFLMNNAAAVLNIYGTFTNSGTWSAPTTGSTVNYAKSGAQSILALSYSNLQTAGSGTKTLAGTTTVSGTLTIGAGSTFSQGNQILNLTLVGTPIVNNNVFDASTGTTNFSGAGNQTIPALTYNTLQTNTSGVKTLVGTTTANGVLTVGASTTLDLGANTLNLGYVGTPLVTTGSLTIGTSTINYSGAGAQAIKDLSYHNLGTTGSGAKTLAGATSVANTLALTDGILTLGSNTLTMNGSTVTRTSGSIDASDASATLAFGNSSLLTLPASVFSAAVNNLTLTGTRLKATSDFSVNGVLNLNNSNPDETNGLLDMVNSYLTNSIEYGKVASTSQSHEANNLNSNILDLGVNATVLGSGSITGKIRRSHTFTQDIPYAYGDKNTTIAFHGAGPYPTSVMAISTRGNYGLHVDKDGINDNLAEYPLIGGAAVKRLYQFRRIGGDTLTTTFTLRMAYEGSDLGENTDGNLVVWDHHLPYTGQTPHEHGKSNESTVGASEKWVEITGHSLRYFTVEGSSKMKYWMLSDKETTDTLWYGAFNSQSDNISNWSSGVIPSSLSAVVVDKAIYNNTLTLNSDLNIGSLNIKANSVVNGGSGNYIITLNRPFYEGGNNIGAWINQGTFNAGNSTVKFNNINSTLSGNTNFFNVEIPNGMLLTMQSGSVMGVAGTLTNSGTFNATANENTVVFNGTNQSIPTPNGTTPGYHNLTIAQTSGTATASTNLAAKGNVLISSGTLNMNNNSLDIKGDFTNNATVSNLGTVTLSGTGAQTIGGTSTTTFTNLTMNGGSGTTTLNQNINVASVLTVGAGKTLSATDKTINLTASGTPFANSGTFTAGTSTVHYNNAGATSLAALTYHNLQSTGAATKTMLGNATVSNQLSLNGTTLDIESNKLTLAGSGGSSPTVSSGGVVNALDGEIELTNAASVLTFPATFFVDSKINDMTLNGAGGVATVENLTLIGDLALVAGTFDIASNKLTIDNGSTVATAGGFVNATAGSIAQKSATLNGNALTSNTAKNLEIDRAGGVAMSGNLEVTDEFKLTVGTLDISSNTLKLDGTLAYTAGGIDADNGAVDFDNTTEWNLPTAFFATNVKTLKVTGVGGIQTNTSTKISDLLEMTGGNIKVNAAPLEIGTDATTVGSINWTNGTVVGPLKRWFANATNSSVASGIFPVGTAGLNRYAQVNFTEAPEGGYLVMEFHTGSPAGLNYETDLPIMYLNAQGLRRYIQNADESGYWEMTPYNAAGEEYAALDASKYNLALRINNPASVQNGGVLNNPPGVKLIRAKGYAGGIHGDWELAGTYNTFEELVAGEDYVIKSVDVEGFSWFNGGGDNQNPLPVELISFTGFCTDNQTTINWKTASEFNSSYYIVEKSTDGQNWREVNNQAAAGFSTEELTYQFIDESKNDDNAYYRLTQIDTDGEFTVYDPIFVSCNKNVSFIKTYPNPSDASFQVLLNNPSLVGKATIKLVDTKGTVVSIKEVEVADGTNLFYLNEKMAPGIYYLSISNGATSTEVIKHSVK